MLSPFEFVISSGHLWSVSDKILVVAFFVVLDSAFISGLLDSSWSSVLVEYCDGILVYLVIVEPDVSVFPSQCFRDDDVSGFYAF